MAINPSVARDQISSREKFLQLRATSLPLGNEFVVSRRYTGEGASNVIRISIKLGGIGARAFYGVFARTSRSKGKKFYVAFAFGFKLIKARKLPQCSHINTASNYKNWPMM